MKHSEAKLISSVSNIFYLTNLSGFSEIEREAFIILTNRKKFLITDKRYSEAASKIAKGFEIIDTGALNFIFNKSNDFFKKEKISTLFIEENNITVAEYKRLKKAISLKNLNLSDLRIIKNKSEILNIKSACKIGDEAFEFILDKLKVGKSEKEISNELVKFFREHNADQSFNPIVAFGTNSSSPHHLSGNTKLNRNQIVLLDFGVKVNNYCSDMTRTIFFGKADEKFISIYKTVLEAQQFAIKKIKVESKASDIDKVARKHVSSKGFGEIIHAVGHGIGIEVHESPTLSPGSRDIIKNGMIFSIEPGIYIPRFGGVRIEDLVLVRDGRAELISNAKREIIEIND